MEEIQVITVKSRKKYRVCGGMCREEFVNFTLPTPSYEKFQLEEVMLQLEYSMGKTCIYTWAGGFSGEVTIDGYAGGYCSSIVALIKLFEQLATGVNLFNTIGSK